MTDILKFAQDHLKENPLITLALVIIFMVYQVIHGMLREKKRRSELKAIVKIVADTISNFFHNATEEKSKYVTRCMSDAKGAIKSLNSKLMDKFRDKVRDMCPDMAEEDISLYRDRFGGMLYDAWRPAKSRIREKVIENGFTHATDELYTLIKREMCKGDWDAFYDSLKEEHYINEKMPIDFDDVKPILRIEYYYEVGGAIYDSIKWYRKQYIVKLDAIEEKKNKEIDEVIKG